MTSPEWRRSSHSGTQQGNCVELATLAPGLVGVRDSKHPDLSYLVLTTGALGVLVAGIKCEGLER